jgi:hypothetical protein
MSAVSLREQVAAEAKRHWDVLKASPLSLSGAGKVFTGEELTANEERVLASTRTAQAEYERHVDALHRMHAEQIAAVPVLVPAPAAAAVEAVQELAVIAHGSQFRLTVDNREVEQLLYGLEHVSQGAPGLIASDGKPHISATRNARRLEELALPIYRALTFLPADFDGFVENVRAVHPQLAIDVYAILKGVTDELFKGVVVAKRQSSDVSLSVHVPLAELDTFRGSLSSSASKEEVKFLKKFKEAAATAAKGKKPANPAPPFQPRKPPPDGGQGSGKNKRHRRGR